MHYLNVPMIVTTEKNKKIDLSNGYDISIPLSNDKKNPLAWGIDTPQFKPVKAANWIGLVERGSSVNFRSILFNPHGNGTHTECAGHITPTIHSVNHNLNRFFFTAVIITVLPEKKGKDLIITSDLLKKEVEKYSTAEALVIRTLPNTISKKHKNYTDTNPPYFDISCIPTLNKLSIQHLLIDLPSVDKEKDGGEVAFHHAFWNVPEQPDLTKTITELIYVPNEIKDGEYLLNLQVAPFENDASPSRPVLFPYI